ncbi:MAG: hypothetical protein V5A87_00955 [Candidatus Bipolaricaulota bacterium]
MSHTTTLQNYSVLLVLIATSLLIASLPCNISRAGDQSLGIELENEVSLEPTGQRMISDHDSEATLTYETVMFEFETSSEFGLEGLSEVELVLAAGKDPIETECGLTFGPKESNLESYELTGNIQLDSETDLTLDYESDFNEQGETDNSEVVLTLDRELAEDLSIKVEGEFSETQGQLSPVPAETKVDLSGLDRQNLSLDLELEFEKKELEEMELDFEGTDSFFLETGLTLDGSVSWKLSDNFVEFDTEFELEFGHLSLETILYLRDETRVNKLELVEVSLDDLEVAGWDLELSNDFGAGESEITLEKDREDLDLEFEIEINPEATGNPFNLGQRAGELTWYPEEYLSVATEIVSGPSSPPEITLASEYEF